MTHSAFPASGEADLPNCEPMHLAGSIQPHVALLPLDEAATIVLQASANAASMNDLPLMLETLRESVKRTAELVEAGEPIRAAETDYYPETNRCQ